MLLVLVLVLLLVLLLMMMMMMVRPWSRAIRVVTITMTSGEVNWS